MKMIRNLLVAAVLMAAGSSHATDAALLMSALNASPATNRIVEHQRLQPFPGNLVSNWSGSSGLVVISNVDVGDYNVWIRQRGQSGQIAFSFSITTNDTGTVWVHTNNLSVINVGTYPKTGQAAWSIAAAESRYARKGEAGGAAVTGAELVETSTNNGVVTTLVRTQAVQQAAAALGIVSNMNSIATIHAQGTLQLGTDSSASGILKMVDGGNGNTNTISFFGGAFTGLELASATIGGVGLDGGTVTGNLSGNAATATTASAVAAGVTNKWQADATSAARLATTNVFDYIVKADPVTPLPNIYTITTYGSNLVTEGEVIGLINRIYTNGYTAYGFDTVQMDAGWATRNASGLLTVQTNVWTNNLAYVCNYAHARGIKIGVYYSIDTNSGWNVFGQINMHTNMLADIDVLATNGVDLIKVDSFNTPQNSQDPIAFWNAVAKSGRAIHRQNSVSDFGNTGNYYALSPASAASLNSAYVAFGLPDTLSPRNFTNSFAHFQRSLAARHYVGPSFKLEGTGWLWTSVRNQYQYPDHCFVDMALMTAERLMLYPDSDSFNLTNRYLIDLLQASPVTVADIVLTNGADMVCSRVIGAKQDGVRAICFINTAATNKTMTYSLVDLGFKANKIVTYYSPWFWNSLEGWATNTISVTVPPTNTVLYKVVSGYRAQYGNGVTYLSDLSWASTCNIGRGPSYSSYASMLSRDYRDGNPATPLIINSTTYSKGFSAGAYWMGSTNPTWEINIGEYNTNAYFYTDFGKQQAWNGGNTAVRLTIYTNGVSSVVSGWVTNNATQAVSYQVPLAGVSKIGFMVETNGQGACQSVLGGCYISSPQNFSGVVLDNGRVIADARSLTNLAEDLIPFETLTIENYTRITVAAGSPSPHSFDTGLIAAGGNTCNTRILVPSWVTNATYTFKVQASGVSTWTNLIEPMYYSPAGRVTYAAAPTQMWSSNEVAMITAANAASNFTFSVRFPATNCVKVFGFKATVATNTSASRYFGPIIQARYQ